MLGYSLLLAVLFWTLGNIEGSAEMCNVTLCHDHRNQMSTPICHGQFKVSSNTEEFCLCAELLSKELSGSCSRTISCHNESTDMQYMYVQACDIVIDHVGQGSELIVIFDDFDVECIASCDVEGNLLTTIVPPIVVFSIITILVIVGGIFIAYIYRLRKRIKRYAVTATELTTDAAADSSPYVDIEVSTLKSRKAQLKVYENVFKNVTVCSDNVAIQNEIGAGAFGTVYRGIWTQYSGNMPTEIDVAIKSLKPNPSSDEIEEFIAESAIMLDFNHPNVLSLLGVCFDTEEHLPLIILPYMANGDLKSFLLKCRGDNEPDTLPDGLSLDILKSMCIDIARGMEYLAKLKFVHRDLAARNCMVDQDLNVKVADFGFSRDIYSRDYYRLERKTRLPVKWLPPESLLDNKYDVKTDIWSFGVVCWEVFSLGRAPYPGLDNADIPEYIIAGKRLKQPPLCSENMWTIVVGCWNVKSDERPTFNELATSLESLHFTEREIEESARPYFVLEIQT